MTFSTAQQKANELLNLRHIVLWSEADLPVSTLFPEIQKAWWLKPLVMEAEFPISPGVRLPDLIFSRQLLPNVREVRAESIRSWASQIMGAIVGVLPDEQPWSLHVEPYYGVRTTHRIGARAWHSAARQGKRPNSSFSAIHESLPDIDAGQNRCRLIRDALVEMLQKKRRHLLRHLRPEPGPWSPQDSLVQVLLLTPDTGYVSLAVAPLPFEQRHLVSPFPAGKVALASDKSAPSRAFSKLVEAEIRLGRPIRRGETCIDLGAAPGSWTYVAVQRGANVIAVDRAPLREDLMHSPLVRFQPGDAFRFSPLQPVDWLLCDVIASPDRSAGLLLEWLRHAWCKHFVVTIKIKDNLDLQVLRLLQRELPPLTIDLFLTRLCANKKEICAFGTVSGIWA